MCMNRKLIFTLICIISIFLTSCGWSTEDNQATDSDTTPFVTLESSAIYGSKVTESYDVFVYDKYTGVVYYMFSNYNMTMTEGDHTFTYFAPYINENGSYVIYDPDTETISEAGKTE